MADKDVVINLVGILHGRLGDANDPYGPDFRARPRRPDGTRARQREAATRCPA